MAKPPSRPSHLFKRAPPRTQYDPCWCLLYAGFLLFSCPSLPRWDHDPRFCTILHQRYEDRRTNHRRQTASIKVREGIILERKRTVRCLFISEIAVVRCCPGGSMPGATPATSQLSKTWREEGRVQRKKRLRRQRLRRRLRRRRLELIQTPSIQVNCFFACARMRQPNHTR